MLGLALRAMEWQLHGIQEAGHKLPRKEKKKEIRDNKKRKEKKKKRKETQYHVYKGEYIYEIKGPLVPTLVPSY